MSLFVPCIHYIHNSDTLMELNTGNYIDCIYYCSYNCKLYHSTTRRNSILPVVVSVLVAPLRGDRR